MKLLVTGASGFIGRAICARLLERRDVDVVATVRSVGSEVPPVHSVAARMIGPDTAWGDVLDAVDAVVHTAALAHVGGPSLDACRRVNVEGTLNLARQAADRGVKRFVFLSSVKVNGENTRPGQAFRAEDPPRPVDAYGVSKHESEVGLRKLHDERGIEVVSIRPPLVYGPGARGNLLTLMRWLYKRYPLPLAGIHNARSLVALGNLVDLAILCCEHPRAANETFMAADGVDLSTAELAARLGAALGRPAKLFPVPKPLLMTMAAIAGRRQQAAKMLGNLQVDASKARKLLGWSPPEGMDGGLEAMAREFVEQRR